jgi:perosamine synthetase
MIYLDDPNVGDLELKYIKEAIEKNEIVAGSFIQEFEEKMMDYLGNIVYCVACASGTSALHMALKVLEIGLGDEVITSPISFIATANPIKYVGSTPVFVDIDPETWNIDPVEIEKAITSRTKAIIVVHLYGNPCNMYPIIALAKKYGLYIIEDACESLGAIYCNQQTGTFGDIGCFSFNGNKVITTGGGGMICTNNKEYADKIRYLINQSKPDFNEIGYNYRMSNIQAAMGLGQLERLNDFLQSKKIFNNDYKYYLHKLIYNKIIEFQQTEINSYSSYWLTSIKIDTQKIGKTIPQIQDELKQKKIPTRRIFEPITNLKPYSDGYIGTASQRHYGKYMFLNSYDLWENGLCLPSSTKNNYEDIEYVANTLLEVLNG